MKKHDSMCLRFFSKSVQGIFLSSVSWLQQCHVRQICSPYCQQLLLWLEIGWASCVYAFLCSVAFKPAYSLAMTDDTKNCPGGDKMLIMLIMQTICGFFCHVLCTGRIFCHDAMCSCALAIVLCLSVNPSIPCICHHWQLNPVRILYIVSILQVLEATIFTAFSLIILSLIFVNDAEC